MRKKQKGGILPLLMLMNAMKGGGIKRKRTKKQKGGFLKQKGGFFIPDRFKYKSGKRPKGDYYKPFGIG